MVIDHVYTENVCIGQVPYYVPLIFLFFKYSNTATGCFIMYVTDAIKKTAAICDYSWFDLICSSKWVATVNTAETSCQSLYIKNVIIMLYGIIILYWLV